MTTPIASRPQSYFEDPETLGHDGGPADGRPPRGPSVTSFCARADTVVEGFWCNDPTVVSNACRRPKNRFDAYVCDEPRMKRLQDSIVRETLGVLKSIVLAWLMRKAPK
jgi:hypothetical protein